MSVINSAEKLLKQGLIKELPKTKKELRKAKAILRVINTRNKQ